MTLTEIETQNIKKYVGELCRKRCPEHLLNKVQFEYRIEGQGVILYEIHPEWDDPTQQTKAPVAKFKYVQTKNQWQLFGQRADRKWDQYQTMVSATDLKELVEEIERDSHGCFFL